MDKLLDSLLASGPLAIALLIALRHQTNQLIETRAELKEARKAHQEEVKAIRDECRDESRTLHGEKEALFERVLTALKEITDV